MVLPDGSRLARTETDTPVHSGPAAIVQACIEMLDRARDGAPAPIAKELAGIGISSPGPVSPESGAIVEPPNLGPKFRNIPITLDTSNALGLPAFLDRDTNVAALGERAFGAARGYDDFIYLTVSTGVGGAIVTGGRLFHGPDGLAGELGHVPVSLDGPVCGCGGIGHVEAYASGAGLAKLARKLVADGGSPFLADRATALGDPELLSAR
ncbi:MAG TPA: ROK family protein, partial [Candidatus Limnocylindrales bacterium]